MSLLTVVQDVCAVVGVIAPTSVFTNIGANRTMFEMVGCANEMAQSVAGDERDWTALYKTQTYVGDGVATAFNLPADYRRMLKNGEVWRSTSTQQPMTFINDPDQWMQRRAQGYSDAWGEWTIQGGQMLIEPAMPVGVTAKFIYIDKNPIALGTGGFGERFMADNDTFRLPERLLKLAMIWKWKSQKGGQYAEDMSTYYDALNRVAGSDKPAPILIDRLPDLELCARQRALAARLGAAMSQHVAFRRQPVPQQVAQAQKTITIPAPTRGITLDENDAFMKPGAAIVSENWIPTLRGCRLRGGSTLWTTLPAAVVSGFEYVFGDVEKMFAATATELFDVTAGGAPISVKSGQTSGNYSASQMATFGADNWLIAVNETGDPPLRLKNGATWVTLGVGAPGDGASTITGPGGIPPAKLAYIWKYRNRFFFIEASSMNAWYLPINSVGGELNVIPLSGSATRGGKLVAGAAWSIDAGDGIDDKCLFLTSEGEVLIFTGSNPGDINNWRQEGRYQISYPMGMNAILPLGGDLLIVTVDGIVPVSQAITKDAQQLELAMLTRPIKPLWRETVNAKRDKPWSIRKWDEYGGIFVATPGGTPGNQNCLAANDATGAWTRITWDATCFLLLRGNMYFGTQSGKIMQADRTGYDDGIPYVCTLVGGWEMFQSHSQQVVWHQARAIFNARAAESFQPQLSATTDFQIVIPQPPPPGPDPGVQDLWDQGTWDHAKWDYPTPPRASFRNTMWVSIGMTGFSHAPIVQVTVAQQAKPDVELIAIAATFEQEGVTV